MYNIYYSQLYNSYNRVDIMVTSNLVRGNLIQDHFVRLIKFNLFHNYTVLIRIYTIQYNISIFNNLLYIYICIRTVVL